MVVETYSAYFIYKSSWISPLILFAETCFGLVFLILPTRNEVLTSRIYRLHSA